MVSMEGLEDIMVLHLDVTVLPIDVCLRKTEDVHLEIQECLADVFEIGTIVGCTDPVRVLNPEAKSAGAFGTEFVAPVVVGCGVCQEGLTARLIRDVNGSRKSSVSFAVKEITPCFVEASVVTAERIVSVEFGWRKGRTRGTHDSIGRDPAGSAS